MTGLRRYLLPWAAMIGLIGLQLGALTVGLPQLAPGFALIMVAILLAFPMQIAAAPRLAWIFALAGLFWLVIPLFALGTLDPLTRHNAP